MFTYCISSFIIACSFYDGVAFDISDVLSFHVLKNPHHLHTNTCVFQTSHLKCLVVNQINKTLRKQPCYIPKYPVNPIQWNISCHHDTISLINRDQLLLLEISKLMIYWFYVIHLVSSWKWCKKIVYCVRLVTWLLFQYVPVFLVDYLKCTKAV